jgi:formate dehydrogenase major subunit
MGRLSVLNWPVVRQFRSGDVFGRGPAVTSARTRELTPRTSTADRVARSVCPYCAVGCGQKVFVKDEKVVQIEGDPDSPISRGRLCPKGTRILYRPPHATDWQPLELDTAIDMIADRFLAARRAHWQDADDEGRPLRRTMGIAALGGATLDNEENYLIKKLFTAAGAIQVENQARI